MTSFDILWAPPTCLGDTLAMGTKTTTVDKTQPRTAKYDCSAGLFASLLAGVDLRFMPWECPGVSYLSINIKTLAICH